MPTRLKDFATAIVAVVEPETTAMVAAQLMRQHHIGALVVVDAEQKVTPVGIVTDRDLVLALMAEGLDPAIFTVGDIMSVELVLAGPDMDAMGALKLMRMQRVRRLVVVDELRRLVGIVSLEDLLELVARELAALANRQLASRYPTPRDLAPDGGALGGGALAAQARHLEHELKAGRTAAGAAGFQLLEHYFAQFVAESPAAVERATTFPPV